MSYLKDNKYECLDDKLLRDLDASVQFLINPQNIITLLACDCFDSDVVRRAIDYVEHNFSSNQKALLVTSVATCVCVLRPEYEVVYTAIISEIDMECGPTRADVKCIGDILSTIKENWEGIMILALFMRMLGKNKINIETGSVFDEVSKLLEEFFKKNKIDK